MCNYCEDKSREIYKTGYIYKLYCNSEEVKDFYIGSTKNIEKRMEGHNEASANRYHYHYNSKLHKTVRRTGGSTNWGCKIVERIPNCCRICLLKKEANYIREMNPELNCQIPLRTRKEYYQDKREMIRQQQKEYYRLNKEKIQASRKAKKQQN